jgi:hypothetical protein
VSLIGTGLTLSGFLDWHREQTFIWSAQRYTLTRSGSSHFERITQTGDQQNPN